MEEMDKSTNKMEYFKIILKTRKSITSLYLQIKSTDTLNTINNLHLLDTHKSLYSQVVKIFFLGTHWTVTKINMK